MPLTSLGQVRLAAFLLVFVRQLSVPCLFRLCLVSLEVYNGSALVSFVFVGDVLYCSCGCIPFGDALGIL